MVYVHTLFARGTCLSSCVFTVVASGFPRVVTDVKSFGICCGDCWRTQLVMDTADGA